MFQIGMVAAAVLDSTHLDFAGGKLEAYLQEALAVQRAELEIHNSVLP